VYRNFGWSLYSALSDKNFLKKSDVIYSNTERKMIFMYCKNCGNEINSSADVCPKCGFASGTGSNYCPNCKAATPAGAGFCGSCGTKLDDAPVFEGVVKNPGKSKIAAGILGILLGGLGIHNFYLGFIGKGLAQLLISLLSCGAFAAVSSIWGLVEGILILTGSINCDASGTPLHD